MSKHGPIIRRRSITFLRVRQGQKTFFSLWKSASNAKVSHAVIWSVKLQMQLNYNTRTLAFQCVTTRIAKSRLNSIIRPIPAYHARFEFERTHPPMLRLDTPFPNSDQFDSLEWLESSGEPHTYKLCAMRNLELRTAQSPSWKWKKKGGRGERHRILHLILSKEEVMKLIAINRIVIVPSTNLESFSSSTFLKISIMLITQKQLETPGAKTSALSYQLLSPPQWNSSHENQQPQEATKNLVSKSLNPGFESR